MVKQKPSKLKPIISVTEMAQMLNLSRARFYQLLNEGIFPQPIYDLRTHRPLYDTKLQKRCLEIRETGIGDNGQYILFYSPREKKEISSTSAKKHKKVDSRSRELAETLNSMGLSCSAKEVFEAMNKLYPKGADHEDEGVVIRELFRYLRRNTV